MGNSEAVRGWRARSGLLAVLSVVAGMLLVGEPAAAASIVEDRYAADGPFRALGVTYDDGTPNGCDDLSTAYDTNPATNPVAPSPGSYTYVYPDMLDAFGDLKVVVWANGTIPGALSDTSCLYKPLLTHLASWGYFVVAPNEKETGSGDQLEAAIQHLRTLNDTSGHRFHQKLDLSRIMAAGHSQGAVGAVRARLDTKATQPDLVDSVLALGIPSSAWVWLYDNFGICEWFTGRTDCTAAAGNLGPHMPPKPDVDALGVEVFFARGTWDTLFGSDQNHPAEWYPAPADPADTPFVAGSLLCADHVTVAGVDYASLFDADPAIVESPCNAFGYITAWAHHTLVGGAPVADAGQAFVGPSGGQGELFGNARWERATSRGLG
jgi:hypothetical protein